MVWSLCTKPRCELKSHRTVNTCWLQGWFNFAGSESSIWQLFSFIRTLATVLFRHIPLTGAAEAVGALINGTINSISSRPPRQTRRIAQLTPSRQGWGCRDSAGASKAHGLAILPPKWHSPRQLTVPPAEPSHLGSVPRAGLSPSILSGPPLSRWEKQHVKQRCATSFILLTLATLTKREKTGAVTVHHFLLCKTLWHPQIPAV